MKTPTLSFFMLRLQIDKKKNEIVGLVDSNGCWSNENTVIEAIVISYFDIIFGSSDTSSSAIGMVIDIVDKWLSNASYKNLEGLFTADDIQLALSQWSLPRLPGWMGLQSVFTKDFGV
ncbi:hypothetical protein ACOSP7_019385 [Xanthoceras sorbifolium]